MLRFTGQLSPALAQHPPLQPALAVVSPPQPTHTWGEQDGSGEEGELLIRQLQAAQGPPQLEDGADEVVTA